MAKNWLTRTRETPRHRDAQELLLKRLAKNHPDETAERLQALLEKIRQFETEAKTR